MSEINIDFNELIFTMKALLEKVKTIEAKVSDIDTIVNGNNMTEKQGVYSKVKDIEEEINSVREKIEKIIIPELDALKTNFNKTELVSSTKSEHVNSVLIELNNKLSMLSSFEIRLKLIENNIEVSSKKPEKIILIVGLICTLITVFINILINVIIPVLGKK